MSKNYYQVAIVIYAIQLFMLAVLVPGSLVQEFGIFPHESKVLQQVLGAIIFVLCFFSIFVIRQLYFTSLRVQQQKIEKLKIKNIEEQNQIYRQHRHDLYNHLTVISGLAQLGKLDSLRAYLSSYLEDYNKSIVTVNTGIKELDVLLFSKISKGKDLGIDVQYQWAEPVTCSSEHVTRIVSIFANAMDNAIQACIHEEKKEIYLSISGDLVDYIFEIANSFDSEIDLENNLHVEGFTTKPGSVRGEGVAIMRKNVRKLCGTMNYRIKDGWCSLIIEIPKLVLEGKP